MIIRQDYQALPTTEVAKDKPKNQGKKLKPTKNQKKTQQNHTCTERKLFNMS